MLCAYGDDGGVGPTLHCEGLDGAVVDVEGVERPHCDLGGVGICGQLEQSAGLPLSDIDPVLSYDAIHLQWGAPVQEDVGGVKGVASGVEWVATRSCRIIHNYLTQVLLIVSVSSTKLTIFKCLSAGYSGERSSADGCGSGNVGHIHSEGVEVGEGEVGQHASEVLLHYFSVQVSDVDDITSDVSVSLLWPGQVPGQGDRGGGQRHQDNVGGRTTGNCSKL